MDTKFLLEILDLYLAFRKLTVEKVFGETKILGPARQPDECS